MRPYEFIFHQHIEEALCLTFGKSISGHPFQTIRKLANNYFQYHREFIYDI